MYRPVLMSCPHVLVNGECVRVGDYLARSSNSIWIAVPSTGRWTAHRNVVRRRRGGTVCTRWWGRLLRPCLAPGLPSREREVFVMSTLQLTVVALLLGAQSVWSMPALAQAAAERLPDKDVKRFIDQVDELRDRFENNLDDKLKRSTVSGPSGELNVSNLLHDYQDNAKKLKERFNDDYSATAEATTVLKQAADIERFMQGTSGVTKGRKEWDAEAASLKHLAEVYGTTFPLPAGATLSRINDKETAAAAAAISEAAAHFKDDVNKHPSLSNPDKDAGKNDVELLIKQADGVKDHVKDDKPATADARQLTQQAARIQAFVDAHHISTANWEQVRTSLGTVRKAFGLAE